MYIVLLILPIIFIWLFNLIYIHSTFQSAIATSVNLQSHLELRLNDERKVNIDLPAVGIKQSWLIADILDALLVARGRTGDHLSCLLARLHEVHRAIAVTPVVHVPVPVRVTLALKFSRSPYLGNHSSESIHTWTIDTL